MQWNYYCVFVVFLVNSDLDQWLVKKKNTLCTILNKGAYKLHRFKQFLFLDKEASSLMGRLNYQLILNLRFKGRGTNFFKIKHFYVKKKWKDSWKEILEMYLKQFFPEDYIDVCNKTS